MVFNRSIFLLFICGVFSLTSCVKDDETEPIITTQTEGTPVSSTSNDNKGVDGSENAGTALNYYFKANISTVPINFTQGVDGYLSIAIDTGTVVADPTLESTDDFQAAQAGQISIEGNTNNSGGIMILKTFNDLTSSEQISLENYRTLYALKSYNYGARVANSNQRTGVDGAIVYYTDNNGVYWATDLGTADQTGSTFEITENLGASGDAKSIIKATFSCKLYNDAGGMKILTNGEFRGLTLYYITPTP